MSDDITPLTAMTFPTSEEPLLDGDKTQVIIDAICQARDAEIKHEFDTYGGVIIDESTWLRAISTAHQEIFGDSPGFRPYGGLWYDVVKRVFDVARADGKLYTRLSIG